MPKTKDYTAIAFYSAIDDAALVHLYGLHALLEVWVYGADVTQAGVDQVQQQLPDLNVLMHADSQSASVVSRVEAR